MKFSNEEILETIGMIAEDKLDIRTVTLGISLLDCSDPDPTACARKVREKILAKGADLSRKADFISDEYGLPIVNKRISLTPISLVVPIADPAAFIEVAHAVDRAAAEIDVNFVGGYTAMIQKGETSIDRAMIEAMPEVLSTTTRFCASVILASTKAGINMDGCYTMSKVMKDTAARTAKDDGIGCAKLVLFANPVEDNPFMAGGFYGTGESESSILVGVSGPGAVRRALERLGPDADLGEVAETIKKTAFKITRAGELVGKKLAKILGVAFGNLDLSLAPTPAEGDSVGQILETMGLAMPGAPGSTAALMMLNDAVKKGGLFASSSVGGLSGAFIPISEDASMIRAAEAGAITLEKLEAMTSVCSVGLDMIAVPGDTSAETLAAVIADEMAIGCANNKTTAVRIIPAPGKKVGDSVYFGGLLGSAPIMAVSQVSSETFVKRGGRIPAPLQSLKN
ncbi:MAG: PFL family protein [Nitrospira sp.]|nr:PFL family protein [bacterium]MBL7048332.1 PFL family protein [Nitrospira sp.]